MTSQTPKRMFGKYEIQQQVGRGAFAFVFKALDPTLQRVVALKVLDPKLADSAFVSSFVAEAQTAAKLNGDHLVDIYEVGEVDGRYYIAMRYLPGTLASRLLSQPPLSFAKKVDIISQIASALDIVHRAGLTHRDVKPSNILMDEDGRAYLGDFGIARAAESTTGLTTSRAALGTAAYFSPELAKGQPVTKRSDVYSFGVVAYEMLAGKLPFESANIYGFIRQHADEAPPAPAKFNSGISQPVQDVLLRALNKKPEDRFASAGDFATALNEAASKPFQPAVTVVTPSLPVPIPATPASMPGLPILQSQPVSSTNRPETPRNARPTSAKKRGLPLLTWIITGVLGLFAVCGLGLGVYVLSSFLIRTPTSLPSQVAQLKGTATKTAQSLATSAAPTIDATSFIPELPTPTGQPETPPTTEAATPTTTSTAAPTLTATSTSAQTTTATSTAIPTTTFTPMPSLAPPPVSAFSDNFNTGLRPEWRVMSGTPLISNGQLLVQQGCLELVIGDAALDNYALDLDFRNNSNASFSLYMGYQDDRNYMSLMVNDFSSASSYWNGKSNGQDVGVPNSQVTVDLSRDIDHLHVEVRGHAVTTTFNDKKYHDLILSQSLAGQVALYTCDSSVLFDNFNIQPLP